MSVFEGSDVFKTQPVKKPFAIEGGVLCLLWPS